MAIENWKIDISHSALSFVARHMMFARVRGHFNRWEGTFTTEGDVPVAASVKVSAEVASIDTADAKRDDHLRSADFFDAANRPTLTFTGQRLEGQAPALQLSGTLSMHGVDKPVTVSLESLGRGKDPWGGERIAFSGKASVNRHDFGLDWNAALEAGGVLVGPVVNLELEIEAVKIP
jgi:polyisoprenoid-binding protein YceI